MTARTAAPTTAVFVLLMLAACGSGADDRAGSSAKSANPRLAQVLAQSHHVGTTDPGRVLHLNLGVPGGDPGGLERLIASGARVTPAEYAARFGPDPATVGTILGELRHRGLDASWKPGSSLIAVDGAAQRLGTLLEVRFDDYELPDGTRFYAADRAASLPATLAPLVSSIAGLNDITSFTPTAIRAAEGLSPQEVMRFYDMTSLRDRGLDGRGEVVMLPGARMRDDDLNAYVKKFDLPPFDIEFRATQGGDDDDETRTETALDVEVIHGIAPAAKLVIYQVPHWDNRRAGTFFARMADTMVSDPAGTVADISYGWCQANFDPDSASQMNDAYMRGAAQGISFFVSSGDEGAFGCFRVDGRQRRIAIEGPSGSPYVTSVGGTTAFFSKDGGYFQEGAWGNPVSQTGTGGGVSEVFARPDWQKGKGVDNQFSNGKRQTPDVAAIADSNTGWDIIANGKEFRCGGTSASAPFWTAVAALVNQDLVAKGLRRVGFANPALYDIAGRQDSARPAFHDVTLGNNLHHPATPGWDFATGWGSPDVAVLLPAWEDYIQRGGK
jgi:kumamolisin